MIKILKKQVNLNEYDFYNQIPDPKTYLASLILRDEKLYSEPSTIIGLKENKWYLSSICGLLYI